MTLKAEMIAEYRRLLAATGSHVTATHAIAAAFNLTAAQAEWVARRAGGGAG